jgi:Zn-dependent M28 family amino/carboxypeptidase
LIFATRTARGRRCNAVNLIARIPGADSSKVMAITAHFDHVGPGENNEIFNGADDNASGVAGHSGVAEHFTANPPGMTS